MPTTSPLVSALRSALLVARKQRDGDAIAALRTTIAAIANAEAVPALPGTTPATGSSHVAGAVEGLGAAEAPRRVLSEDEVLAIVVAELAEREAAAARYRGLGHAERADRLIAEADALRRFADQDGPPEKGAPR